MSYQTIAANVLAKCAATDPYFPQPSKAVILAWSEHLEMHEIDQDDALAAVTKMYSQHGVPGFKPTVKLLVDIARDIRKERLEKTPAIEQPKLTKAEWEARHGERFPEFKLPSMREATDE